PSIWLDYCIARDRQLRYLDKDKDLRARLVAAEAGETGIDGFDAWAQELVGTGYLHNHARMWFASIWIFTLKLPWELGADFFLRHLADGDPASNTLSWRWVAGLHTVGKNYAARTANIAKYTQERFRPTYQLANNPAPLEGPPHPLPQPVPLGDRAPIGPVLILVTEEDCAPLDVLEAQTEIAGVLGLSCVGDRSSREIGQVAKTFAEGAVADGCARVARETGAKVLDAQPGSWAEMIARSAEGLGVSTVATGYAPTGPVATRLATAQRELDAQNIRISQIQRDYDSRAWPHTTKSFFKLKQKIPHLLKFITAVQ
ncbi:MAG: FAD-binding domain-containing protein, partial [Pseudomonadota bacterium]